MRRRKPVFHGNSWWKRPRSSPRCGRICRSWNSRTRWKEPVHTQDQVSTTDPDSTYATQGGTPARLGYYDNYLVDKQSCVIVGVQARAARLSPETVAAEDMLTGFAQWQGRKPESVGGRHDVRERGVSAMVGRAGNHSVHADARECEAQEQPLLWTGAFYRSAGKQQLSLSGGRTTPLGWLECSQSCSRLHWQRPPLWDMLAKTTMHEWTIPISCDPHG
jgi:hypothetical protein